MAVALDQIVEDIKSVLPIYDTEMYDNQLYILVQSAISKLENEGVPNAFDYGTFKYYDYITCLRYQVARDMDFDIDDDRLNRQYITRVNTLRCILNQRSN